MPGRRIPGPNRIDWQPNAYRGRALLKLPPDIDIIWPKDGGFWLRDRIRNVRLRRIDERDLRPNELRKHRGKGGGAGGDDAEGVDG
jgi:hypothetical protein